MQDLKDRNLFNTIRTIGSSMGAWIMVDGQKVLNLCANNYLGFADHPRLKEAAKKAIDEFGVGPTAVRSIAGTMALHLELEEKLANFKGVEAAISFQGCFSDYQRVIPTLTGPEDMIFSDELNHASIIDGCRLSKAKTIRYKHCDVEDLEEKLKQYGSARRKLVITDGVFSMDGDVAPMDKIVEVAEEYDAMTMADDAHGEGVLGRGGRGIGDHFGLHNKIDIEVGTMSKACGVVGGYIAGKKKIVDYLRQRARPFLFSSAVTPADCAACIAAVDILTESDELVQKLWRNADTLKTGLNDLGFDTGETGTPITPVLIRDAAKAKAFSKALFENNIFAMSITFPTVPRGTERLRLMNSATHSDEDIEFALGVFEKVGKELGAI
jgi:glycine C-acetyltransferase